jgi:hypothetical protein
MKQHNVLQLIALIILVIGGLNWGLIGLFEWDLIGSIFGFTSVLTRTIYSVIGLAAVYKILCWIDNEKK